MRIPRNETVGSDTSGLAASRESGSERRCVLTGQGDARDALVRLAISPPDEHGLSVVLPDAHARAPGRGAWIGVNRDELRTAVASGKLKGALARAYKQGGLTIPADLADKLETALRRALTERLGLEMRSGKLVLGSDRIAKEARMGKVAALFHAADASEDGARKLDQAWRVGSDAEGSGLMGARLPLDRLALSVALGRENVVHLALADERSAMRVSVPLMRLNNYLGADIAAQTRPEAAADDAVLATDVQNVILEGKV